jgi:hypothetical protein
VILKLGGMRGSESIWPRLDEPCYTMETLGYTGIEYGSIARPVAARRLFKYFCAPLPEKSLPFGLLSHPQSLFVAPEF